MTSILPDMTKIFAKKSMSIGSRIAMVVVIMLALIYGTLALAERSTEALRLGLQDFLSQLSRGTAEITALEKSELVPEIVFHAKGIVIRDREDADKTLISAEQGYLALDFWRAFFGFSRLNGLEIRNLQMASGYLFPRKLDLAFVGISDPPPHVISPVLLLEGRYNNQDLMATLELRRHGNPELQYDFGKVVPMTFKLGNLEASGFMERKLDSVVFEKITLHKGNHVAIFSIRNIGDEPLNIALEGTLDDIPFTANIAETEDIKTMNVFVASDNLKAATRFFEMIENDFGLEEDNQFFRIDIQTQPENKESVDP